MSNYTDTDRKKDFNYFIEHYQEFYREYGHKFIAIKNEQVLGAYETEAMAIDETAKNYPFGTFIVQECNGDETGYTNFVSSWQLIKL